MQIRVLDVVYHLQAGNFQQKLPHAKPRTVRIFLASNKSDFNDERQLFWKEVVPELQHYCLQFGADLVIIDPFQNSNSMLSDDEDLSDNPYFLQKMIEEVHESREISTGVFFVALIGDKYGSPCLPISLKPEEMNHIRSVAFEIGLDVRLLDEWYKMDNNALPPVFVLWKNKDSKKELDSKTRKRLMEIIQKSANQAFNDGLINQVNQKSQDRLFYSSMQLLCEAAMSSREASRDVLLIMRRFEGIKQNTKKRSSVAPGDGYFDKISHDPSGLMNFEKRLTDFKNSVASILDKPNIENFRVFGSDIKSWLTSKEREKYLDSFVQQLSYKLKQLIGSGFRSEMGECLPGKGSSRSHSFSSRNFSCSFHSNFELKLN